MVREERAAWAGLIVSVIVMISYALVLLRMADGGPITEVDWVPAMLWTIAAGIAATAVLTIGWGIVAGLRDPDGASRTDIRDRDISRMGGRVEHAFVVIAGLGVIVLCGIGADLFWIAHTMFAGFAVSAFVGGIARVIAYRRGLV